MQDRIKLRVSPCGDGPTSTDTMIHSKVMVIDDKLLRIGSANINNRSMGTDTECDLTIEAAECGRTRSRSRISATASSPTTRG